MGLTGRRPPVINALKYSDYTKYVNPAGVFCDVFVKNDTLFTISLQPE